MKPTRRALFLSLLITCTPAAAPARSPNACATPPRNATSQSTDTPQSPSAPESRIFHVTVTDAKGNVIHGIKRESLSAFDGGEPREIVSFGASDVPASVMFLVDTSSSSFGVGGGPTRLARLKESLTAFLGRSNVSNEYFVTAFNQRPQVLLDGSKNPYDVIIACDRLAAAYLKGFTAFNDALYLSLNKLASRPTAKRVLILLSDGMENASKYSLPELRQALRESDAVVYAVGLLNPNEDSALAFQARLTLEELAETSGGAVFYPQTAEAMKAALTQIADELRNQYEVAVATAPRAKGDGWHDVRFKLGELRDANGKKVKALIRTRRGFYDAGAPRRK
jgi:Ca-activated chloride channel family protein